MRTDPVRLHPMGTDPARVPATLEGVHSNAISSCNSHRVGTRPLVRFGAVARRNGTLKNPTLTKREANASL